MYFNNEVIMKIIETSNFLKKQAQFNDLPGDPSLPPGVTNQMISEQFDGGDTADYTKQFGEHEFKIDWAAETTKLINAGYDVQGLPQQGLGDIIVYYEYDAEVFGNEVQINNLRLSDIKVWDGQAFQVLTVSEPKTKEGIFDGLQEEIVQQEKNIIKESHIGSQDYGPDTRDEDLR